MKQNNTVSWKSYRSYNEPTIHKWEVFQGSAFCAICIILCSSIDAHYTIAVIRCALYLSCIRNCVSTIKKLTVSKFCDLQFSYANSYSKKLEIAIRHHIMHMISRKNKQKQFKLLNTKTKHIYWKNSRSLTSENYNNYYFKCYSFMRVTFYGNVWKH